VKHSNSRKPNHQKLGEPTMRVGVQSFGNIIASGVAGLLWSLVSSMVAFVHLAAWAALAMLV
jgi:hypothetical protein